VVLYKDCSKYAPRIDEKRPDLGAQPFYIELFWNVLKYSFEKPKDLEL